MNPSGEEGGEIRVNRDGVPVGLYQWAQIKITGAIIDAARDGMRQHGRGRSKTSRFETLSLDMPWENDGERTLGETLVLEDVPSQRWLEQVEDRSVLVALRGRLTPKEWDILTRYADGQTLKSIGEDVYGVTESRICQLMAKITAKSRRILESMEPESEFPVSDQLTPLEREEAREADWVAMLETGEIREQRRIEKNRARYAAKIASGG